MTLNPDTLAAIEARHAFAVADVPPDRTFENWHEQAAVDRRDLLALLRSEAGGDRDDPEHADDPSDRSVMARFYSLIDTSAPYDDEVVVPVGILRRAAHLIDRNARQNEHLALLRSEAGGEGLTCLDYAVHDWNSNGSPSFCRRCQIEFPTMNALRAALSPSSEAPSRGLSTREFAYQQSVGHASPEHVAELRRRAEEE